jgi:hypothetical protein
MRKNRKKPASSGRSAHQEPPLNKAGFEQPPQRTRDDSFSLFHYTTASGLIGIIETKSLWATHASFLNDTTECQLLSRLLTPQIEADFRRLVPELMECGAFRPEIQYALRGDALTTEAEKATSAILRAVDRTSPIHITSFCRHAVGAPECDHGLLSQWRGYAKGGFAIEFDESQLDDLILEETNAHSYQGLITRQVEYHDHRKAAKIDRFEGLAAATLRVGFRENTPNLAARPEVSQLLGDRDLESYIRAFVEAVPFLKSPRFAEENEYRIVALPTRSAKLVASINDKRPWKEISFREGWGGTMVPFIRLFKDLKNRLPIKKIIVGPHRDQENQMLAAKILLEKHGFDVQVVKADTAFRF